jgi:hypothetical protein
MDTLDLDIGMHVNGEHPGPVSTDTRIKQQELAIAL